MHLENLITRESKIDLGTFEKCEEKIISERL